MRGVDKTTENKGPSQEINKEPTLFSWNAPSRPFKRRDRRYWVGIVATASLVSFILFIAEGVMPVVLLFSILLFYYVLSTVEPPEIGYKITKAGVEFSDGVFKWKFLKRYWFERKFDTTTLNFEMSKFPGRLELVVKEQDIPKVRQVLNRYLTEDEGRKTVFDRASDWVSQKILHI
jgi:hypothetical protein